LSFQSCGYRQSAPLLKACPQYSKTRRQEGRSSVLRR